MYNLTTLQNATYVIDIMHYANDITGGVLGTLFLVSIFFILFFTFKLRYDFDDTLTSAAFLTSVISLFLYLAGLINIWIMIVFVVITLACILYLYIGKQ